jgi:cell division protein FtsW
MRIAVFISIALIFVLGLLMIYNTSSAEILDRFLKISLNRGLIRQIIYALLGIVAATFFYRMQLSNLVKGGTALVILGIFLLLLVYVPGIGQTRNGAARWIGWGGFSFQPSELVKFFLLLGFLDLFSKHGQHPLGFSFLKKIALLLGVPILLVLLEPDHGGAFVMFVSILPLFFLAGIPLKYWLFPVLILGCLGAFMAYQVPYVKARMRVYLNPQLDKQGKGHQPYQAKIAAGSGKLLGKGPGGSLQKLTYLPEAQNDYIAAIFAEEFGFLGMVLLLSLYMVFSFGGFAICFFAKNPIDCLLAAGITFLISFQAFLNLGVVSGLLPSKGVNLPFFSQGGTSLLVNFIMCGCLLKIAKQSELCPIKQKKS